jgi:PP-loop superfamily ATP-utilizing enzyme
MNLEENIQHPTSNVDRSRAGIQHPTPINREQASNIQSNWLARIEVGAAELPKLLANGLSAKVAEELKKIGYAHVTVDLQGYRRGSLNETTASPARQT